MEPGEGGREEVEPGEGESEEICHLPDVFQNWKCWTHHRFAVHCPGGVPSAQKILWRPGYETFCSTACPVMAPASQRICDACAALPELRTLRM